MTPRCSLSKLCKRNMFLYISRTYQWKIELRILKPKNMKPSWLSHPKRHSPENAQGAHSLGKICASAGLLGAFPLNLYMLMLPGARTICETQSRKLSWTLDSPGGFMLRGRKEKGTIWDLEMTCSFLCMSSGAHALGFEWVTMCIHMHRLSLLILFVCGLSTRFPNGAIQS